MQLKKMEHFKGGNFIPTLLLTQTTLEVIQLMF